MKIKNMLIATIGLAALSTSALAWSDYYGRNPALNIGVGGVGIYTGWGGYGPYYSGRYGYYDNGYGYTVRPTYGLGVGLGSNYSCARDYYGYAHCRYY